MVVWIFQNVYILMDLLSHLGVYLKIIFADFMRGLWYKVTFNQIVMKISILQIQIPILKDYHFASN